MNARHLAHAQPLSFSFSAPEIIKADFRLSLLEGDDNPFRSEGMLSISGRADEVLPAGITEHTTKPVSAVLECPPTFSVELRTSGHRLLAFDLELTELGDDGSDIIEVRVTSRGLRPEHADCLGIATKTYAWRLFTQAKLDDGRLQLTFELVQGLLSEKTILTMDGVPLPFDAGEGDKPAQASSKVKRWGTDIQIDDA